MSDKARIYEFLNKHRLMTLATASLSGKPEAATVEYVMDGEELLINTFIHYKKYKNLIDNPQVACVITENENFTLQIDANILELADEEANVAKQKMIEKEPGFADFFNIEKTRFFRITPTWMRLRDYTTATPNQVEITI